MEMVCQLPCLSILQTPWGHDLDENSVQASSILKPPCARHCRVVLIASVLVRVVHVALCARESSDARASNRFIRA